MSRYNRRHSDDYYWPPYVSVAQRKKDAAKKMAQLKKKGVDVNPVIIPGRNIASTFWGKSWCNHLESYSDYDNRLPRGRTYVRNGSVINLNIEKGEINAMVSGSSIYDIKITIKKFQQSKWQALIQSCAGAVDSLIELLQGKFSNSVMELITHKKQGLFPNLNEITVDCSCPDSATMCKHVAATLYGVGARLDEKPEHLFLLRQVNHLDLINSAVSAEKITRARKSGAAVLEETDLSSLFGIDLDPPAKVPRKTIVPKVNKMKIIKKPSIQLGSKTTRTKKVSVQKKTIVKKITRKVRPTK